MHLDIMTLMVKKKLNQTYSFVTGGYQTIDVINPIKGSIPTRTCKSTNFAENAIFNVIK